MGQKFQEDQRRFVGRAPLERYLRTFVYRQKGDQQIKPYAEFNEIELSVCRSVRMYGRITVKRAL